MTDLQLSLIDIAGVFVAGVYSYNKVQEYRARKSVDRAFANDHDDVLMRAGDAPVARHEPSFSADDQAPGVAAVSYTHLDVYKRQGWHAGAPAGNR